MQNKLTFDVVVVRLARVGPHLVGVGTHFVVDGFNVLDVDHVFQKQQSILMERLEALFKRRWRILASATFLLGQSEDLDIVLFQRGDHFETGGWKEKAGVRRCEMSQSMLKTKKGRFRVKYW